MCKCVGESITAGNQINSSDVMPALRFVGFFWRGALRTLTILAVQVREQEHQWKCKRSNNCSNPRPDFEGASSTLGNPAGKIDTTDKQREDYDGAHRSKLRC